MGATRSSALLLVLFIFCAIVLLGAILRAPVRAVQFKLSLKFPTVFIPN